MKSFVSDETRSFMEEQFADCTSMEELADLYAAFQIVTKELLKDRISDFERTDQ
jgi:hypothetical protein